MICRMILNPADKSMRRCLDATARSLARVLTQETWDGGFAAGAAGAAIFLARYAVWVNDEKSAAVAMAVADAALEKAMHQQLGALYTGFLGAVWAATYVGKLFNVILCSPAMVNQASEIAVASLDEELYATHFDLLEGVVGIGLFGLLAGGKHQKLIVETAIGKLVDGAETTKQGITWQTQPQFMLPEAREMFGDGYYNIGLAHGVPGVIAFLSAAVTAGFEHNRLVTLIKQGCDWLLTQTQTDHMSIFPHCISLDGTPHMPSRLSWCYGDLSVAIALASAAHALNDEALRQSSSVIARSAALRVDGSAGVYDNTLCHGASGVALIFRHLYIQLGCLELLVASRYWLRISRKLHEHSGSHNLKIGILQGLSGFGLVHLDINILPDVEWPHILLLH